MPNSSASLSLLSVISLLSFFVVLLINKFSNKIKNGALLDEDFVKPQAFHQYPTARSGGYFLLFFIRKSFNRLFGFNDSNVFFGFPGRFKVEYKSYLQITNNVNFFIFIYIFFLNKYYFS